MSDASGLWRAIGDAPVDESYIHTSYAGGDVDLAVVVAGRGLLLRRCRMRGTSGRRFEIATWDACQRWVTGTRVVALDVADHGVGSLTMCLELDNGVALVGDLAA